MDQVDAKSHILNLNVFFVLNMDYKLVLI